MIYSDSDLSYLVSSLVATDQAYFSYHLCPSWQSTIKAHSMQLCQLS